MLRFCTGLVIATSFLVTACSKKEPTPEQATAPAANPVASAKASRDKAIASLKTQRTEDAAWEVAVLADSDPEVVTALVELMKDKTNAGLGRRLPEKYSSVREASVQSLVMVEAPGIAALKSQGYPILREGLSDPLPAVREHTILAIASLGEHGKPLAGDVFTLCTDSNERVRGVAFDALGKLGVTDGLGMVKLLQHSEPDVRRLAAEAVMDLERVPEAALPALLEVFNDKDPTIRTAAVRAVSLLGAKAAAVVPAAVMAIRKIYPKPDSTSDGDDQAYWALLTQVGEPSVAALVELLKYANPAVQYFAALTLGQIGPAAKGSEASLKSALMGSNAQVVFTAAVALCRIGKGEAEATAAITRGLESTDDLVISNAIDTIPLMGKAGNALVAKALAKADSEMPFTRQSALELAVLLGPAGAAAAEALGKAAVEGDGVPLRLHYLKALATMGPSASPALDSLLKIADNKAENAELRRGALNASVAIAGSSPPVLAILKAALTDPSVDYQAGAVSVSGRMNPMPAEVAATLAGLLAKNKPNAVRRAAVKALALATPPAANAKAALEPLTAVKDDSGYWARFALVSINGTKEPLERIVRDGLKDRLPSVRAAAIEGLPKLGDANAKDLATVAKLLRDTSPVVRTAAATELVRHGPAAKVAVPALGKMLMEPSVEARNAAIAALASIGPDAAMTVARLKGLVKLGDENTAYAARIALAKIQPDSGPKLPKKK